MRFAHVAGVAVATALLAFGGPVSTAQAEGTGIFRYSLPGGNEETIDDPTTYMCYEVGAADKSVTRGFNQSIFTAELYADTNCQHSMGHDVRPNTGFVSQPVGSVAFRPTSR